MHKDCKKILFTEQQIIDRCKELGKQITEDYKDNHNDVLFVGILKGSVPFMAELVKRIDLNLQYDFIAASSYVGTESAGDIKIVKDLDCSVVDRDIVLIEDIIDTGLTIKKLKELLYHKGAPLRRVGLHGHLRRRRGAAERLGRRGGRGPAALRVLEAGVLLLQSPDPPVLRRERLRQAVYLERQLGVLAAPVPVLALLRGHAATARLRRARPGSAAPPRTSPAPASSRSPPPAASTAQGPRARGGFAASRPRGTRTATPDAVSPTCRPCTRAFRMSCARARANPSPRASAPRRPPRKGHPAPRPGASLFPCRLL